MIPKELILIQDFVRKENVVLTKSSRDGRTNSAQNEQEIIRIIKNGKWDFEIVEPEYKRLV